MMEAEDELRNENLSYSDKFTLPSIDWRGVFIIVLGHG